MTRLSRMRESICAERMPAVAAPSSVYFVFAEVDFWPYLESLRFVDRERTASSKGREPGFRVTVSEFAGGRHTASQDHGVPRAPRERK